MNTNYSDTIARAFVDEIRIDPIGETCSAVWLRVTGAFGGGLAVTALLAAIFHH
jgi:hypothetical protein